MTAAKQVSASDAARSSNDALATVIGYSALISFGAGFLVGWFI